MAKSKPTSMGFDLHILKRKPRPKTGAEVETKKNDANL